MRLVRARLLGPLMAHERSTRMTAAVRPTALDRGHRLGIRVLRRLLTTALVTVPRHLLGVAAVAVVILGGPRHLRTAYQLRHLAQVAMIRGATHPAPAARPAMAMMH